MTVGVSGGLWPRHAGAGVIAAAQGVCCAAWRLRLAWSGMRRVLRHRPVMRWPWRWRRTGSCRSWRRAAAGGDRGAAGAGRALLERDAERDAELEELRTGLAVLQRMLFGRSSEKSSPEPRPAVMMMAAGHGIAATGRM